MRVEIFRKNKPCDELIYAVDHKGEVEGQLDENSLKYIRGVLVGQLASVDAMLSSVMADRSAEEKINDISEELLLVLEETHQLSKEEAAEAAALALNKMKSGNYLVATVHLAPSVPAVVVG